jgi:uncharacterized protein YbaA (DUF1428 family)
MDRYIDAFVLPIKREHIETYREIAEKAGKIWMDHGALAYVECLGDDLNAEEWGMSSFIKLAKCTEEETVIFSWILYESREHRDQVNEAVTADPRMEESMKDIPFEMNRMAFGGFKTLVNL